jgi:hypothetical protein
MSIIIFSILAFLLLAFFLWVLNEILWKSKWEYGIYFLLFFLPIYITLLSLVYQATLSPVLVTIFQLLKEVIVMVSLLGFLFFNRNIWNYPFRLHLVDLLFIGMISLGFIFMLLPVGEATFGNKVIYFKNMLMPGLVYFLGRNTVFTNEEVARLFKGIFFIAIAAFAFNLLEKMMDVHIQSLSGYALYNSVFNDIEPSGNFGLTWTFETQAVTKRLASFFSDPLELASSVLLGFAAGLIWYLTTKRELGLPYLLIMCFSLASLFFSSSRAAFGAFFVMVFFIAVIFRLYKLILFGVALAFCFFIYVVAFASEDFYYFVIDTITFENASSMGHLIEWFIALDAMVANPLGAGLAMSGNVGSVTDEVRIGGENQFLIYGVQLGVLGMLLYILLLTLGIIYAIRVFRSTQNLMIARIAFTAAAVKTGLLLPLFTANAEMYAYVSWISWWMVGYAMNEYSKIHRSYGQAQNIG